MGKLFIARPAGITAAYEAAGETMALQHEDETALEGIQAFIEKRSPRRSDGAVALTFSGFNALTSSCLHSSRTSDNVAASWPAIRR
jgi:hypothetical protein